MFNVQITTTAAKLTRSVYAAIAISIVAVALIATSPAHADTKKGTGGTSGCQIENDGKLETVPVGSKIGLFTCGSDGEWHFGWLINAVSAPHKTIKPVSTNPVRHGVLRVVKASR